VVGGGGLKKGVRWVEQGLFGQYWLRFGGL
jgi:hypothetical protein